MTISGNRAGSGSAVYLGDSATSSLSIGASATTQVRITGNTCTKGGGTLVWRKAPGGKEVIGPSLPNVQRVVVTGNSASFANGSATQATSLAPAPGLAVRTSSGSYMVTVLSYFSEIKPHIVLKLVDYYGVVNTTDSSSTVMASAGDYNCAGHPGYLR